MCRFGADGVSTHQRKHADAQLKTSVDNGREGDDSKGIDHVFLFLAYLCLSYSISVLFRSKFTHFTIAFLLHLCLNRYIKQQKQKESKNNGIHLSKH